MNTTFGIEPSNQYRVREAGHPGFATEIKFYNDFHGIKDEFNFKPNGKIRFWADCGEIVLNNF